MVETQKARKEDQINKIRANQHNQAGKTLSAETLLAGACCCVDDRSKPWHRHAMLREFNWLMSRDALRQSMRHNIGR